MRLYELHMLYNCDLTANQVEEAVGELSTLVANHNGKVNKTHIGDIIVLKYKIKKSNVARYVYMSIEYDPAKIAELNRILSLKFDIHRFLINAVEKKEEMNPVTFAIANEKDYRQRKSDYWDSHAVFKYPNILRLLTTERGKILPRKSVQEITKHKHIEKLMRRVKVQIKIARFMAWLPYF